MCELIGSVNRHYRKLGLAQHSSCTTHTTMLHAHLWMSK
jgi:hypothetical protein